jgi:hypothetical protein
MLEFSNSLIIRGRSIIVAILQPFSFRVMQPQRIPIPVETAPRHRMPNGSHPNAYSRIHPPSTTQL